MAYGRYSRARTTRQTTNRTYAKRRTTTTRRARSSSRTPEVRIVLEAPGVRMPARTVALPTKRKPF